MRLSEIEEKGNRSGGAQCADNRLPCRRLYPFHEIVIDFNAES
jgi:hypothetical protein